ncbi:FecR domain-containing protein [Neptuniibacter sp. PT8_73]|uniref:FecR family protein n=1 Tax=unclassified Neptuniibacter TaxID=2630693 RepID=UPI0039F68EE7
MIKWLLPVVVAFACTHNVMAADKAGHVLLSVGTNSAKLPAQDVRPLKRKSEIYSLDSISTGSKGRLQIRFTDGSRLSLRPDTLFNVEDYRFSESLPKDGKSVYRLLKGGLRTLTGAISDNNKDNYEVRTPIATIGVRGTHYTLFYCDKACQETTRAQMGLYGYVLEGEIVVGNKSIKAPIQMGRYFFLGGNGSNLKIRQTPFKLFELLQDMGPDLMSGTGSNQIPALNPNEKPNLNLDVTPDLDLDVAPKLDLDVMPNEDVNNTIPTNRNENTYP